MATFIPTAAFDMHLLLHSKLPASVALTQRPSFPFDLDKATMRVLTFGRSMSLLQYTTQSALPPCQWVATIRVQLALIQVMHAYLRVTPS